jgi:hypothetical protein
MYLILYSFVAGNENNIGIVRALCYGVSAPDAVGR